MQVCKEAKDEINKDGNKALESLPGLLRILYISWLLQSPRAH